MNSDNKQIRDVADVAARIMAGLPPLEEKLHPNQQKLDVHEPEKDQLTADDFKNLRAGKKADVKKEEVQSESVEQLNEVKMADLPVRKVQGRAYGASKPEPHAVDTLRGPKDDELKKIETEKKKKKFSEMVDIYKNGGLKSFMESIKEDELIDELSKDIADYTMDVIDAGEYTEVTIGEEASQEEFNTEIKKAQAKSEGKDKAEVAKGAVQAVKQEETEITDEMIFEVLENAGIDFESLSDDELQEVANEAHDILSKQLKQIDEREMTDAEMKKREKIVKGMKKGMAGFKERYGERAKSVMYATANKQAMKD